MQILHITQSIYASLQILNTWTQHVQNYNTQCLLLQITPLMKNCITQQGSC